MDRLRRSGEPAAVSLRLAGDRVESTEVRSSRRASRSGETATRPSRVSRLANARAAQRPAAAGAVARRPGRQQRAPTPAAWRAGAARTRAPRRRATPPRTPRSTRAPRATSPDGSSSPSRTHIVAHGRQSAFSSVSTRLGQSARTRATSSSARRRRSSFRGGLSSARRLGALSRAAGSGTARRRRRRTAKRRLGARGCAPHEREERRVRRGGVRLARRDAKGAGAKPGGDGRDDPHSTRPSAASHAADRAARGDAHVFAEVPHRARHAWGARAAAGSPPRGRAADLRRDLRPDLRGGPVGKTFRDEPDASGRVSRRRSFVPGRRASPSRVRSSSVCVRHRRGCTAVCVRGLGPPPPSAARRRDRVGSAASAEPHPQDRPTSSGETPSRSSRASV